jgi:hypothetical protein
MNRSYMLWNLREAAEELTRTIQDFGQHPDFDEAELRIAFTHLYHHLNTAWNARRATDAQAQKCSQPDFMAWRRFPSDIDMSV